MAASTPKKIAMAAQDVTGGAAAVIRAACTIGAGKVKISNTNQTVTGRNTKIQKLSKVTQRQRFKDRRRWRVSIRTNDSVKGMNRAAIRKGRMLLARGGIRSPNRIPDGNTLDACLPTKSSNILTLFLISPLVNGKKDGNLFSPPSESVAYLR